ncbi:MAG: hypothetical protein M1823_003574 [Watsoniomyces obsoletus]|nr:MAG: hypothetical protein M1823_003574 [Watsoniomyces obsoletus]
MGRVDSRASARTQAHPNQSLVKKHKPHKIVFESVTQQKKKLRTIISFHSNPPAGFTFVPAGHHPQLTQQCKEVSRLGGHKVYIVSTSHKKANNITQHVHRIGYHFASTVVHQVTQDLGLSVTRSGHVRLRFGSPVEKLLAAEHHGDTLAEATQEQLNAQAQDALVDLFPKMPANDRSRIIHRAFKRGKGKVGTADSLPLARRVQLAVVAHIRHVHTDYDRLLRQVSYDEARRQVQEACLRKLMEWRGDDEDDKAGPTDLEDIMREVIVISDSEDDDEDDDDDERGSNPEDVPMAERDRDSSVEFIASHPVMQEVVQELVQEPTSVSLGGGGGLEDQDDNGQPFMLDATAEGGRRYAVQPGSTPPKAVKKGKRTKKKAGRRKGFHRYSAVDQLQQWAAARADAASQAPTPELPRDGPSSGRTSALIAQPFLPSLSQSQPAHFSHYPRSDLHDDVRPTRFDLAGGRHTSLRAGHPMQPVSEFDIPPGSRPDGVLRYTGEAPPRISFARSDDAAGLATASGERRGSWLPSPAEPTPHVVRAPVVDLSGTPTRYDAEGRRLSTAPPVASSDPWGPVNHDHRPMVRGTRPSHHERQPSPTTVRDDWLAADPHQRHPARHREMSSVMAPPPARERREEESLILIPQYPSRPEMNARSRTWDVVPERHLHLEQRRPTQPHPDTGLLVRDDVSRPSCEWVERSHATIRRAIPADQASSHHDWEHIVEVERRPGSPPSELVLVPHHSVDAGYPSRGHHFHQPSPTRPSERPMLHHSPLRASYSSVPIRGSPEFPVPSLPRSAHHSHSFITRQDVSPGSRMLLPSHRSGRDPGDDHGRGKQAHPSTIMLVESPPSRDRAHQPSGTHAPLTMNREVPVTTTFRHASVSGPLSTRGTHSSFYPPSSGRNAHDASDKHISSFGREGSFIDHHGRQTTSSARSSMRPFDEARHGFEDDERRRTSLDPRTYASPDHRRMLPPNSIDARTGHPLNCIPDRASRHPSTAPSPRSVIVLE